MNLTLFISCLAIFLLDLLVELGVAMGILYLVPILFVDKNEWRLLVKTGLFCIFLIILGYVLSPHGGEVWKVVLNRIFPISVISIFLGLQFFNIKHSNLFAKNKLLQKIVSSQTKFLDSQNISIILEEMLDDLLGLTKSQTGIYCELLSTGSNTSEIEIQYISWGKTKPDPKFYESAQDVLGERITLDNERIFQSENGECLSLIENHPNLDWIPSQIHQCFSKIDSIFIQPIYNGRRLQGLAILANRTKGYNQRILNYIQPYIKSTSVVLESAYQRLGIINRPLSANKLYVPNSQGENNNFIKSLVSNEALKPSRLNIQELLEQRVLERTRELIEANYRLTEEIEEHKNTTQSQSRLLAIIESTSDFVGIADKDGKALYVNKAGRSMLGYDEQANLDQLSIPDFHPTHSANLVLSEALEVARQKGTWVGEVVFLCRDGSFIPTSQVIISHKSPDGECEFYSTIARDIRNQKRTEENLIKSKNEIQELYKQLQNAVVNERTNISREIHDEIGQFLTSINLDIAYLSEVTLDGDRKFHSSLEDIGEKVDEAIEMVRNIATRLRPEILDLYGLQAAFEWKLKYMEERTGITSNLIFDSRCDQINKATQDEIFSIFQEALTNIIRHSKATVTHISLKMDFDFLELKISDNGIGIPENISPGNSLGLMGMKERVNRFEGKLDFNKNEDHGTTVLVHIPIEKIEKAGVDS